MNELQDRIALVTGAAAGMGEATAHVLARAGAIVVVSDVQDRAGEAVAAAIRAGGGRASYVHADVSREDHVAALVAPRWIVMDGSTARSTMQLSARTPVRSSISTWKPSTG